MNICLKCSKDSAGVKGEKIAYVTWAASLIMIPLFGIGMIIFILLGLYLYLFHHSRDHICPNCQMVSCPECSGEITQHNFCKSCNIAHCQYCGHHQSVDRSVSWVSVFFMLIIAPFILVLIFALSAINIFLFPIAYLFYEGFTSPFCANCKRRILIASM